MLSPRARAFTVEHLVAKPDQQPQLPELYYDNSSVCLQKSGSYGSYIHNVNDESGGREIGVELCQGDLWQSFNSLGTEMIITKSGRRMFPAVRVRLMNLLPDRRYRVSLDFQPVDLHKYRYAYHSSKWTVSGAGERPLPGQKYAHPDCPLSGRYLMDHVVSFEKLKLTNNSDPRHNQVSLVSMQRFVPRLHVELLTSDLDVEAHFTTSFPQTHFMAVTAYQNQEITRLKIARNPFAKGFRESSRSRSRLDTVMSSLQSYLLSPEVSSRKRGRDDHEDSSCLPAKVLKPTATRLDVPCPYTMNCCCSPCVDLLQHAFPNCLCQPPSYPREITPCTYHCTSAPTSWKYSYLLPTYHCPLPVKCAPISPTLRDHVTVRCSPIQQDDVTAPTSPLMCAKTRVKVEPEEEEVQGSS